MVVTRSPLPQLVASMALVTLALAGCIADPGDSVRPDASQEAQAIIPGIDVEPFWDNPIADGPDHDHKAAAQHADHRNIEELAYLGSTEDEPTSGYKELDIVGDHAYQCFGSGFRIIDISDRADPQQISLYSGSGCSDVKVTSDGAYAVMSGNHVVNITDKSLPVLEATYPRGCHMCFIHQIDGVDHVFMAQSLGGGGTEDELPLQGVIEIYKIVPGGDEATGNVTLEPVTNWFLTQEEIATHIGNGHMFDTNTYEISIHDMYVYDDTELGKPVMVVAHWDMGVWFVDVSDPTAPLNIGVWDDFKGDCGDIHTVEIDWIDGKRILAAATENGVIIDPTCSAYRWSVGFVYLVDVTDLADPLTLGKWKVPGATAPTGHPTEPFPHLGGSDPFYYLVGLYSAHNIHFVNGKVYEALYHGGLFVIDAESFVKAGGASDLDIVTRTDHVPTVGAYQPTCDRGGPNVWDVYPKDGYLYASDIDCGLHVFHHLGDNLNDPMITGDA